MEEILQMSNKEIDRFHILKKVDQRELTQIKAGELMGISDRQVRNLLTQMKKNGARGLVSKKRGQPSNHRISKTIRKNILEVIRLQYVGFGPTLISEKLEQLHKIKVSSETLRLWMLQEHLWIPKKKRKNKLHPSRPRRECFGELDQADGSHHRWFGDEYEMYTLLVFIDDATGWVTSLHMCKQETLLDYFIALEKRISAYGRPRGLYTDHLAVFSGRKEDNVTHFRKACNLLDIELILASSPQAKGRVERANRTLQDRLVKEFKLRNITTIEEANRFLPEFMEEYNKKFSKEPACAFNANRPLENHHDLDRILCLYTQRTLSKDLVFQYHNRFFQVTDYVHRSKGKKIEIRETMKGKMRIFLGNLELKFAPLHEIVVPLKDLSARGKEIWKPHVYKPVSKDHPWKRNFAAAQAKRIERIC